MRKSSRQGGETEKELILASRWRFNVVIFSSRGEKL